jgi:nicotinate phosphoribosyltransferase
VSGNSAVRTLARHTRGPVTLLADAYDTNTGWYGSRWRPAGYRSRRLWVRLDSGDLGALARSARRTLDAASMIIVSSGLDEYGTISAIPRP